MATYTKQELKDAYFAKVNTDPSIEQNNAWFAAEVARVQAQIDDRLNQLTARKAEVIATATARVNEIQARIDAIEPDAKEKMKAIALNYIWAQDNIKDIADNSGVSL